jgi:alkylation response protein AidB-like acyl-CoA dehydrogenase
MTMDFSTLDDLADHRERARAWVQANVEPGWAEEQYRTGTHTTMELHARLARDGILGAGWPAEYGGTEVDPDFARAVYREISELGLEMHAWMTTYIVIGTIKEVGTEEQRRTYIPAALRGELRVALGYSEPDSGSDVASAKTTALRDGDEWVIDGQKMFTSSAEVATHVFVLARTDPELPKHKGLTLFLVPITSEGLEVQPIYTLGSQRTNSTFYTNVRVPDRARIGGLNDGWGVMKVALVFERGAGLPRSAEETLARDLAHWAIGATGGDGGRVFDDPQVAERIGRIATEEEVSRLLDLRLRWQTDRGELPGVEGSMRKLFSSEATQRAHRAALDILGAEGILAPGVPGGAPASGVFEAGFRASVVETIYGGASEIMREIIAEGRLGLPRMRPRG